MDYEPKVRNEIANTAVRGLGKRLKNGEKEKKEQKKEQKKKEKKAECQEAKRDARNQNIRKDMR